MRAGWIAMILLTTVGVAACNESAGRLIPVTYKCENSMPLAVVFDTSKQLATVSTDTLNGLVLPIAMFGVRLSLRK